MKTAVIIGGGCGGLFTGAFLARNGIRVTVLEKNDIIGGGLQCFHRNGKIFETGMHVTGGFGESGNLTKICRYLGILDKLELEHIDPACMDEIRYASTGETYRIPSGRENFIDALASYFPDERSGICDYINALYRLTEEVPLYYLREEPTGPVTYSEQFDWAADRFIAHYVKDSRLREVLAYLNPLYSGIAGHTPAYVHALINVLYINGATRFVDGSQQLADALADVIESNNGKVHAHSEVKHIEVRNRNIEYVETMNGDRYTADWYIGAIHPLMLTDMMPANTFSRSFTGRLREIPLSRSAFSLYIDFKPDSFPYIGHTCYYLSDYGKMWNQNKDSHQDWPTAFMYMTPPDNNQGPYASRMLVYCLMDYADVKQWSDTTVGHRGDDYMAWKQLLSDKIIARLGEIYPGVADKIAHTYSASPLTIRDYYNTCDGAIFGYRKDCNDLMLSQLSVYTKIRNLLLTGQNINLHGMCGVPLTAIITADAILGTNFIVNEINECN